MTLVSQLDIPCFIDLLANLLLCLDARTRRLVLNHWGGMRGTFLTRALRALFDNKEKRDAGELKKLLYVHCQTLDILTPLRLGHNELARISEYCRHEQQSYKRLEAPRGWARILGDHRIR